MTFDHMANTAKQIGENYNISSLIRLQGKIKLVLNCRKGFIKLALRLPKIYFARLPKIYSARLHKMICLRFPRIYFASRPKIYFLRFLKIYFASPMILVEWQC